VAYDLTRGGVPVLVFDQDERVGGLAQTASQPLVPQRIAHPSRD
jgi:protoporphyrinogen oxidase